jgi:16S rRNA (uracil1498-N3)-methyltransferase
MTTERRLRAEPPFPPIGEPLLLGPDAAHHARVLRLAAGDRITLFDGQGHEVDAAIETLEPALLVRIVAERATSSFAPGPVLVQCLPKGKKLDDIVRAATEIGVSAIHLATSERTIARPDEARALARLDRLQRIVDEALRQSEGTVAPTLHAPAPLLDVARRAPASAARIVLSPREGIPFVDALASASEGAPWLLVGPEGGLALDETRALIALGWTIGQIDAAVMRTETAGAAAIAIARAFRSRA